MQLNELSKLKIHLKNNFIILLFSLILLIEYLINNVTKKPVLCLFSIFKGISFSKLYEDQSDERNVIYVYEKFIALDYVLY